MVRYTGPPADRQRGGQPPQSIYQTKTGQGCDKNLQTTENKGVISKSSVLFTATDEGDDGVGSVIDTTKVTSSTPADQPCPSHITEPFEGVCCQDRPPQTGQVEEGESGEKSHTKGQKWVVQHAKAALGDGKLFGFTIELAGNHQVKPNKNGPLID